MENLKYKMSAGKILANILITLFIAGLVYVIGLNWIDPAPLPYLQAMFYFAIAGIIVWLLKWVFANLANKWVKNSYFLFGLKTEIIFYVAFTLLMPFTGDAGA